MNMQSTKRIEYLYLLIIPLVLAVVYLMTLPSAPLGDGWVLEFENITTQRLFPRGDHLISLSLLYGVWRLSNVFGFDIEPLFGAQIANIIFACMTGLLIYRIARYIGASQIASTAAAVIHCLSLSCWAFLSAELHHSGMFFIVLSVYLSLRGLEKYSVFYLVSAGVTAAIAASCHLELGSLPLVITIYLGCQRKWRMIGFYTGTGILFGFIIHLTVVFLTQDVKTLSEFIKWEIVTLSNPGNVAMFGLRPENFIRIIKSQLSALVIGAQYGHDFLRYKEPLSLYWLLSLTSTFVILAAFFYSVIYGTYRLFWEKKPLRHFLYILTGWFFLHKLTFNLLVGPWWPEFSLIPLIPLVLLAATGLSGKKIIPVLLALGVAFSNLVQWALPRQSETRLAKEVVKQIPLDDLSRIFILNPQFMNFYNLDDKCYLGGNGDTELLIQGDIVIDRLKKAHEEGRRIFLFLRPDLLLHSVADLQKENLATLWDREDMHLEKSKDTLSRIMNEYEFMEIGAFPYRYRGSVSYGYAYLGLYELKHKSK